MNEEIRQLTELQVIDLEIAKLDIEMSAAQAKIDKRLQAYNERQESIVELQGRIKTIEARRRELEAELADELNRLKDRQTKMMQVQTNREYQSILKEIEDGKKANKSREEEMVRLMEQIESLEKIGSEQANLSVDETSLISDETKEAESRKASLAAAKAVIEKKRTAMAQGFNASLIKKYDMLRLRRNGRAVVGVTGGVCQGCFMSIPPQQYNDLLKGDKMLFCPTCQRILFHLPEKKEG
ncbi:MAG: hypothetical protein A2521_10100 [Deltaproteobacteria bacterium RIFOXYD12_FULL_57_12]|nr:MAG: hypothetical protein A2521_10100 [Deltaproteobacteria bacterium RIFOXYD12_FULL_57_12]